MKIKFKNPTGYFQRKEITGGVEIFIKKNPT